MTSCDGLTDDPPSRDHHKYIQSCLAQSSGISVTPTQIFTNVSKLEHSRLNTFDSFRITFKFKGFLGVWFILFYRVNRRHFDRVRIRLMLISDWFIRVHAGLNQIINSRTGSFWDHWGSYNRNNLEAKITNVKPKQRFTFYRSARWLSKISVTKLKWGSNAETSGNFVSTYRSYLIHWRLYLLPVSNILSPNYSNI